MTKPFDAAAAIALYGTSSKPAAPGQGVLYTADGFSWPPISPSRARQAIDKARRDTGMLLAQPSQFLTRDETDAVRAFFMREGKGSDTFNSVLARIARAR